MYLNGTVSLTSKVIILPNPGAISTSLLFVFHLKNKWAHQLAHPHRLIRAFVTRYLDSMISKHDTSKTSVLLFITVAQQAALNLTGLENSKTGFLAL